MGVDPAEVADDAGPVQVGGHRVNPYDAARVERAVRELLIGHRRGPRP